MLVAAACVGCGGGSVHVRNRRPAAPVPSPARPADRHPPEVSGEVWLDRNRDGVLERGEPGIAGVAVELVTPSGIISTATNASGDYSFQGTAGVALTLELPVGQSRLSHDRAGSLGHGSGAAAVSLGVQRADLDEIPVPVLAPGQRLSERDFGFVAAR